MAEYFAYPQRACPHPYGSFVANGCDIFLAFQTAELAEKIRRSAKTQLRGVALSLRQHDMLLFQIVRFSPAADGVLKALRKLAVFRIRYADALM